MYIDYMKSEYYIDSTVKKNGNGQFVNFSTRPDVVDWFTLGKMFPSKPFGLFGEHLTHRKPIHNIRSRRKIYKPTIA